MKKKKRKKKKKEDSTKLQDWGFGVMQLSVAKMTLQLYTRYYPTGKYKLICQINEFLLI